MLNKKTEYRMQYSKVNKDLRRKIWQDNITLRKSRQESNQATHYWEYQLRDENCDCVETEDDDETPLPPNRQKHKNLREQYSQKNQPLKSQFASGNSVFKDAREKAVQTPEWVGDEPDHRTENSSEEELMKNMSSLTIPEAKDSRSRPPSPSPPKTEGPLVTNSKVRTARSLSRPSRTSLKLHVESKQTPFVPFGWNEKKPTVGTKQTYNVTAPKKEVHDSAVQAAQRRKIEINRFLAQEKSARSQQPQQGRSRERTCSSSTSQWVSEYQEQFSVKSYSRNSRPLSAPPAARPVSWRRS